MVRLALILHMFIGCSLAGIGVIAALVTGYDQWQFMLGVAVVGFLGALPVSWFVAQQIYDQG